MLAQMVRAAVAAVGQILVAQLVARAARAVQVLNIQ
jgi:hypothetical protein